MYADSCSQMMLLWKIGHKTEQNNIKKNVLKQWSYKKFF